MAKYFTLKPNQYEMFITVETNLFPEYEHLENFIIKKQYKKLVKTLLSSAMKYNHNGKWFLQEIVKVDRFFGNQFDEE